MIINKIDNHYIIKIINKQINIYDSNELEDITKKIILKINKNNKLQNYIHLEIYLNKNYGSIIKLIDSNSPFISKKEKTVKITIHTDTTFLYQIDYFDINKENSTKKNIYYYKNKFYLKLDDYISIKDYLNILELSKITYEDTEVILDKGIKI